MSWLRKHGARHDQTTPYATTEDFRQVFTDNLDGLYRLALLLTGDTEKAEQCFVQGIEDCVDSNLVFKEWALAWAKRAIVQNAVRSVQPSPKDKESPVAGVAKSNPDLPEFVLPHFNLSSVLTFETFERFVFVLSVLDRYSEQECAALLGCSVEDVRKARNRALEQFMKSGPMASAEHGPSGETETCVSFRM